MLKEPRCCVCGAPINVTFDDIAFAVHHGIEGTGITECCSVECTKIWATDTSAPPCVECGGQHYIKSGDGLECHDCGAKYTSKEIRGE